MAKRHGISLPSSGEPAYETTNVGPIRLLSRTVYMQYRSVGRKIKGHGVRTIKKTDD